MSIADKGERILFGQSYETTTLPEEAMPQHSWAGPHGDDVPLGSPFQVFLFQPVLDAMWQHAHETPRLECAGALFGHAFVQPEALGTGAGPITFVVVAAAMPYVTPERTVGHVRVTAEAQAQVDARVARENRGLRPVGWYHTHPGHGIFLSGYDLVITRGIFNAPWQVAIVLDPVQAAMGLFKGAEGERLAGFRTLRELPLELTLMQLYSQVREDLADGRPDEALQRLQMLDGMFRDGRSNLPYWRNRATYRDIDECRRQAEAARPETGPSRPPLLLDEDGPRMPPGQEEATEPPRREEEAAAFEAVGRATREGRSVPRPIGERVSDRTLEAAGRGTSLLVRLGRWPARAARGLKSVLSRPPRGKGGSHG